jgi:hypothetical protein
MPAIVASREKFRWRGFDALALAMQYDPPIFVVNYAQARNLRFAAAIDNTGQLANACADVQATPTSFLVDPHSRIVKRHVGAPASCVGQSPRDEFRVVPR